MSVIIIDDNGQLSRIKCRKIEISMMNNKFIVDEVHVIDMLDVQMIVDLD